MTRARMELSEWGLLRNTVRSALWTGVATSAALTAAPAAAQEAAQPATESSKDQAVELETLQVTGSRLPAPGLTAASPVTTVSSAEISLQGITRIEDLINQMPQVFAGQGAYLANGATGTATVDLRNLGPARTLVLIDGKRLVPGDPRIQSAAPDLNNIPTALVDRVEIMTGGASAVYGSDAIAGVVNFIMLRDFEGVRLDAQHSFYQHNNDDDDMVSDAVTRRLAVGGSPAEYRLPESNVIDGERNNLALVMGMNSADGNGNATLYATYQTVNAVDQGQRSVSECALGRDTVNDRYTCSGSSTNATGRFTDFATFNFTVIPSTTPGEGGFRNFSGATDQFNFNPYNYFQRNNERYGLGTFAHYTVNQHFDVYTDIMYMDDRTDGVIAPSGSFFLPVTTDCSNPLIGANDPDGAGPGISQLQGLCGGNPGAGSRTFYLARRNVEGGGRDDDLRHTSIRTVLGTKGEIVEGWNYDLYTQYGETQLTEIYRRDFSITRIFRSIDVITGPALLPDGVTANPNAGQPQCRSEWDGTDINCVPWDIWTPGAVTAEALNYLQTPGFLNGQTVERIASFAVTSDLGRYGVRTPNATDGVSFAIGAEYRRETSNFETDTAFATGDLAGQGGATLGTSGGFQVKEAFTEMRIPLIQGQPGAEDVGLDLGYRYSDYKPAGKGDTYKFGGHFAPNKDVNFRLMYNRALRAPNVIELSSPLNVVLNGNTDPCAGTANNLDAVNGANEADATLAQCLNDPAIAADPTLYGTIPINPAAQYNGLTGTTPGLEPETADTVTMGVVITPTFIKDLSITIDYYDVKVHGLIAQFGQDTILNSCYGGTFTTPTESNPLVCPLINRDAVGSLWVSPQGFVIDPTRNTGSLASEGVDIDVLYDLKIANWGGFQFDFRGTHIINEDHEPIPGGETFGCEGLYGLECGTPVARWRHKFRTTWQTAFASLSAQWRHISSVEADRTTIAGTITNDRSLDKMDYLDVAATVPIMGKYSIRTGVTNVLDRDPPAINQDALPSVVGSGNTFPQVYDPLGRYIFIGAQLDF